MQYGGLCTYVHTDVERFIFLMWHCLAFIRKPWGKGTSISSSIWHRKIPLDLISKTGKNGSSTGLILESTAMLILVICSQRALRYAATHRINLRKNRNSWKNHCLDDSSVLWNGNYFKTHSVLTGDSGHQKGPFISELYTVFFYSLVVYIHGVQVSKCSRLWVTG